MMTLARYGLGADAPTQVPGVVPPAATSDGFEQALDSIDAWHKDHPKLSIALSILRVGAATAGAYHGYKRNQSVGWSVAWFGLGAVFPLLTTTVSVAQGWGKPRRP